MNVFKEHLERIRESISVLKQGDISKINEILIKYEGFSERYELNDNLINYPSPIQARTLAGINRRLKSVYENTPHIKLINEWMNKWMSIGDKIADKYRDSYTYQFRNEKAARTYFRIMDFYYDLESLTSFKHFNREDIPNWIFNAYVTLNKTKGIEQSIITAQKKILLAELVNQPNIKKRLYATS